MRINAFCLLLITQLLATVHAQTIASIPQVNGIVIDANTNDWADHGLHIDAIAPANGTPLTPQSDDPHFRLAWDNRGLLVLATSHHVNPKAKTSIEILVGRPGSIDRYLTTINPSPAAGELPWTTNDFRQQMQDRRRPLKATVSVITSANQYVIEALLPWENLSIDPQSGQTVLIQLRVNVGSEQYRWNPASGNNAVALYPVQLSASAPTPPIQAGLSGRYERLRRIRLNLVATGDLAGKSVDIFDGGHPLGSAVLSLVASRSQALMTLPMPSLGTSYGPLTARIADNTLATLQLPPADSLREDALAEAPLLFKPFIFTTEHFPSCEFEYPLLVDELFGPYTLQTTFYDSNFSPVTKPTAPGRYGAITEVHSEQTGKSFKRYSTLYRPPTDIDWSHLTPSWTGLTSAVTEHQAPAISLQSQHIMRETFSHDPATAVFLAWLNETPADAPATLARNDATQSDRQWWYRLQQKIGDVAPLKYLAYTPKDYDQDPSRKWPLILFLHGAGERGDDLNKLKSWGIPLLCEQGKNTSFIAICPLCPARESWLPMSLNELLDHITTQYRIDPDRIYVTGASMGGNGTWNFAQQYPDRIAAIAPVCGGGDPNDVASLKNLPIWIFHGQKDPVVPFRREQAMIDALSPLHGRMRLTIYPGIGHECWNAAYATPDLIPWLLQQRRGQPLQPAATQPEIIAP
ncbi:MAG TPA: dienelactone hydrolase family protein [Tepidisphaeraceae bacterium]|jgi:predicted esterase|nr:dienelactone hydrolase family protein [Tepidisphaeraceae bacterium]